MSTKSAGNLCIIPARGGSKGIPQKNISYLGGQPLIVHSIKAARTAQTVDRVVVSTDDPTIGQVAKDAGAEIVWRPNKLSGDTASSESALIYTLEYLEETEGYDPELLIFLQCTSPLTLPEDIDKTVKTLVDHSADSAFTATEFHYFLWRRVIGSGVEAINHDQSIRPLRQEREPQYLETGAVYVMRARNFRKTGHRFFGNSVINVVPGARCLEIDEPVDLEIAEALMRNQAKETWRKFLPKPVEAIVMDFDGVFTDNRVVVFEDGREAVIYNRGDGLGLQMLKQYNFPMLVLSSEKNPVVTSRCDKLGVETMQGIDNKAKALEDWTKNRGISLSKVIYIGNDSNDIDCMKLVGCPVAVADATEQIKSVCKIELSAPGGHLAVRELTEMVEEHLQDY